MAQQCQHNGTIHTKNENSVYLITAQHHVSQSSVTDAKCKPPTNHFVINNDCFENKDIMRQICEIFSPIAHC